MPKVLMQKMNYVKGSKVNNALGHILKKKLLKNYYW